MTRRRSTRGFTLVELLLVMVIISILAGIALPLLRGAVARADAARVRADVRQVEVAALQYREDIGRFPASSGWGRFPAGLEPYLSEGTAFAYKEVEYRVLRSGNPRRGEQFRFLVRYARDSQVGEALQAFRGERVIWTRRRTTFEIYP